MPGAKNHEPGRRAVRNSDAGRAPAWVAAATSGHAHWQQRLRSAAATQPVGRRQSPRGLTRQVKLARRVPGRCRPGIGREDGSVTGPRKRLERSDYHELGVGRTAFLGQFLRQKLKISGVEKKTSKVTASQADINLNMNCACFWVFLARVGQKLLTFRGYLSIKKDNILNFPNLVHLSSQ